MKVKPGARPLVGERWLDDWMLQTIVMCPANGRVVVEQRKQAFVITGSHPEHMEPGGRNVVEIRIGSDGEPFLYFDWVLFSTQAGKGFGAVAFFRAAQAASRARFQRIDLLAAGGAGYKHQWTREFNGYHSWARFGFNAPLHASTLALIKDHPKLSGCTELLDIIDNDPEWWKQNGDGCELTFDLRSGSRSWYTLTKYLSEKELM